MKKKLIKGILMVSGMILLSYGFTEGVEWHRLASCMVGSLCVGLAVKI